MDRETLGQRIKYELGVRNTFWTFVFLVTSGTVSLVFHLNTVIEKIFFGLGLIISLFFIFLAGLQESLIEKLLKMYERNKNYDTK